MILVSNGSARFWNGRASKATPFRVVIFTLAKFSCHFWHCRLSVSLTQVHPFRHFILVLRFSVPNDISICPAIFGQLILQTSSVSVRSVYPPSSGRLCQNMMSRREPPCRIALAPYFFTFGPHEAANYLCFCCVSYIRFVAETRRMYGTIHSVVS